MINMDLAYRTLDHIAEHPEEHNQSTWRCGTTACYAGHAAILAGAQWCDPRDGYPISCVHTPDGVIEHVRFFAQQELQLTDGQADRLFHGSNTLEKLREIVDDLVYNYTEED